MSTHQLTEEPVGNPATPLEDDTPAAPPSLASLPFHLLQDIALRTDEETIWRMMGTCRSVREAAETAVKPYLSEMEILGGTSLKADNYSYDPESNHEYTHRVIPLQKAYRHYESRLKAYIPAKSSLRRLKIELHVDGCEDGWSILRGVSHQLEHLELHYLGLEEPPVSFSRWLGGHPMGTVPPNFSHLTHLTLVTTHQIIGRHADLFHYVTAIRHLTLHCHTDDLDSNLTLSYITSLPNFTFLETLSVLADLSTVCDVVAVMTRTAQHIRQITILGGWTLTHHQIVPIFDTLSGLQSLEVLAVYGPHFRGVLAWVLHSQHKFPKVKCLLVEEDRSICEYTRLRKGFSRILQNLNHCFPALQRQVFIRQRIDDSKSAPLPTRPYNASPTTLTLEAISDTILWREIFEASPSLREVWWLSKYPDNPATPDIYESWAPSSIIGGVDRDTALADLI